MAKRRRRRRVRKVAADVLSIVTSARAASKTALRQLRREIGAAKRQLEKLVTEERSFRLEVLGTGGPGRSRGTGKSRKRGRPGGAKANARRAKPSRKGPAKADKFLAKLPAKFTLDDVRKVAGKAAAISLAQWGRSNKVKKTASGYEKFRVTRDGRYPAGGARAYRVGLDLPAPSHGRSRTGFGCIPSHPATYGI
jgi:hypothetical protein